MKNKGLIIFLIILLAILALAITGVMFWLLSGRANFGFFHIGSSSVSENLVYDKQFEVAFPEINIDSDAGDIYIKQSNNDEVSVKIYGETEQLDINDEGNLNIKYIAKKCIGFCFNIKKSQIEITLPKDYEGKIDLENKFGDTKIDEFLNANATITHDYGDITLDGINKGKVVNKCGDINIGTIADAEVENNYGDIEIKKVLSHLKVDADCGDIEIKDLKIDQDSDINNSMGDISVGSTNEILIEAETSLGEVNIRNNNYKSDIVLKIDNSCGDISVKN